MFGLSQETVNDFEVQLDLFDYEPTKKDTNKTQTKK